LALAFFTCEIGDSSANVDGCLAFHGGLLQILRGAFAALSATSGDPLFGLAIALQVA
jgi:hypothetical protein